MASSTEREVTMARGFIRYASYGIMSLSFAIALPATETNAQPLGPSMSQLQSQTQAPVYEKAQVQQRPDRDRRRWRRGWRGRPGFGFGPRKHCWWGPHG